MTTYYRIAGNSTQAMTTFTPNVNQVLNRMDNWKMETAYLWAKAVRPELPPQFIELMRSLSDDFGDCGRCEGNAFALVWPRLHLAASLVGYEWCEESDYWVPIP